MCAQYPAVSQIIPHDYSNFIIRSSPARRSYDRLFALFLNTSFSDHLRDPLGKKYFMQYSVSKYFEEVPLFLLEVEALSQIDPANSCEIKNKILSIYETFFLRDPINVSNEITSSVHENIKKDFFNQNIFIEAQKDVQSMILHEYFLYQKSIYAEKFLEERLCNCQTSNLLKIWNPSNFHLNSCHCFKIFCYHKFTSKAFFLLDILVLVLELHCKSFYPKMFLLLINCSLMGSLAQRHTSSFVCG
eukprot:TRINITY_DN7306_c0_g1_i6.p1 TRINITY_DN7306_c0_g1~~TRINITY_DN7306_c0_g1_i6.p1  ORF type:complete len:267 (+),score=40.44 TRINITY_DN7306_c0_g1_i6:69-803(+)